MRERMATQQERVRIVGGGMTGLTLAVRLSDQGIPVSVYEEVPYLGGLASESALAGIPVERYYHCVLPTDTALLELFESMGLSGEIGWNRTRTGFFHEGKLLEMTTVRDFMKFPALHVSDRIRLAWTIGYCALHRDWQSLDREPVGPFLRRHSGDRLFESIWEPLLLGKLGTDYNRFAASFIWATISRMLSARKAKERSEKLGFVRGRYGKVFAAMRAHIEKNGGEVCVGGKVECLLPSNEHGLWALKVAGNVLPPSRVVLCVPAPIAAPWIQKAAPLAFPSLASVEYLGVVCEVLVLKRSLTPFYVLNLTDRSLPFTGVIETSNLTGRDEFQGKAVVYLPRYASHSGRVWDMDDNEVHAENMKGLKKIVPDLDDQQVDGWTVNRARYVQPVHPVGEGRHLPPVRLAPGLAYISTAQIHPWPVFNDQVVSLVDEQLGKGIFL